MNRNWYDFKILHSNFAGARLAFENACETLIRVQHPDKNVKSVRIKQGDGGIDIFLGNLGVEPIDVFQCKFFLDNVGTSQKSQIDKSFLKAKQSNKFSLKSWTLCLPKEFDIDEHNWFSKWKLKKEEEFSLDNSFIKFMSGNELIDLMKSFGIYDRVFRMEDSIRIKEIHAVAMERESAIMQLKEIEEKKLILSVMPNLWLNGGGYNGSTGEMNIDLNNKGEDAKLLEFKLNSNDIILHSFSLPFDLEKGKGRRISGRQKGDKHIQYCEYEIEVRYSDKLGNEYFTLIKGMGANVKIVETKKI